MRTIELTQGYVAVVDDEDYERVAAYKWRVHWGGAGRSGKRSGPYAYTRKVGRMHRFILSADRGVLVDHKDGDGLNNTRSSIRLATKSQNGCNRNISAKNRSGVLGVRQRHGKWTAEIKVLGRKMYLGAYQTIDEAARVAAEARAKLHGEFAANVTSKEAASG